MTVNDFMNYNNPCFNCNSKIAFTLNIVNKSTHIQTPLKPIITQKYIKFKLLVGYGASLDLIIDRVSNKFSSNNPNFLLIHLKNKEIHFVSHCDKCETEIKSNLAELSFENGFIKPITISYEYLVAKSKNHQYIASSNFEENKSHIMIVNKKQNSLTEFSITTKLLPLYKVKTKEKLIDKIKLYSVFS
jgi:hypothetical protein